MYHSDQRDRFPGQRRKLLACRVDTHIDACPPPNSNAAPGPPSALRQTV